MRTCAAAPGFRLARTAHICRARRAPLRRSACSACAASARPSGGARCALLTDQVPHRLIEQTSTQEASRAGCTHWAAFVRYAVPQGPR